MKKLPFCTLSAAALFVVCGIASLLYFPRHPEPFSLLFPLLWDFAMVGIGLGLVFRCEVARKAGIIWSIFCIVASLAIGVTIAVWALPQHHESLGNERIAFMAVAVLFGVLFGAWQLRVLRSPTALAWTAPSRDAEAASHPTVRHG